VYQPASGAEAFVSTLVPTVTSPANSLAITPSSGPRNVNATQYDNGRSTVSWNAPVSDGGSAITGYVVVADDTTTPMNGNEYCTTTTTSCVVLGLTNGDVYTFAVYAINVAGSTLSSPSASIVPASAPSAPGNVTATSNASRRSVVSWSAPSITGGAAISDYAVKAIDITKASRGGESCTTSAVSCVVSGLTNGDEYSFVVVATNAAGTTSSSPSPSVTPRTSASAPRMLQTDLYKGAPTFTWRAPSSNGGAPITGYDLYVGTKLGQEHARFNSTALRTLTFTWHHAHPGKYYVIVKAVTLMGEGASSASVKVVVK
jgi:hypothetical protein